MQRIHILTTAFFIALLMMNGAMADEHEDDDEEEATILGIEGEDLGSVALYLMIATIAIVLWKPLFKWLRANGPERFDREPREFKRQLGIFNRRFMKAHNWFGISAAVVGTIHGYVVEWHWTLWIGMGAIWLLVVSGLMMQWKWPPREFRRGARLLHLQRTLTIVAIVLLWVGHQIVD